jgi:iron(III) transport system ATP-binding protein
MHKLAIRGIGRNFGESVAVQDFSLDISEGEFISLLGPSGCGKTTMLRMIAGFIPPTSGIIEMNGKILSSPSSCVPPERRGMSMIFQSYAIWPNMTVAQNVGFGLKLRRLSAAEIARRTSEILGVVQLAGLADRYPAELSGGQQQRVALARAIVIEPQVLLLDEPLSNLDANLRDEMRHEIRRIHDQFKITTIYVTHDQAEAMVTSDRIVVMNKGRLEQVDRPYRLYNAPRTRFVASFIGRTNFIRATIRGGIADFGGFSMPVAGLPVADSEGVAASALYSIRPQCIDVARCELGTADGLRQWLPARVVRHAYFGDYWDYTVALGGGMEIVVSKEPREQYDVDQNVWIGIDPTQMSLIIDADDVVPDRSGTADAETRK